MQAAQTSIALTLTAADDADASAETLTLALTAASGYTVSATAGSTTVTITPMGVTLPALSVTAASNAIQEGQTSTITIAASSAPASTLTIPYTIAGTGIAASDYTLTSGGNTLTGLTGSVTLLSGGVAVTLTLTAADDADTVAEMLTFTLNTPASGAAYTVGATSTATITITPMGVTLPALSVTAAPNAIQEGQTSTITIMATTAPSTNLPVSFAIAGTNITTDDYTLTSGSSALTGSEVTLVANTTSVTITLTAADDVDTSAEMLTFTLTAGTGYTVATSTATITINPLPSLPVLTVAAASSTIVEEDTNTITITATPAPSGNLTVPFTITGTGITSDDYTLADASGTELAGTTVTLVGGTTSVAITLTAVNDTDGAETLNFTLTAGTGYTVGGTNTAEITIDPRPDLIVQFVESQYATDEPSPVLAVMVELTAGTPAIPVTIPVMTANDTAAAGEDYMALVATVTFPAGASGGDLRQTLAVNIIDDVSVEGTEQFLLEFGTLPAGVAASGNRVAMVRILDDDGGNIGFVSDTGIATISEDGGTLALVVRMAAVTGNDIDVMYTVEDGGTATPTDDYILADGTLSFAAGAVGAGLMQTVSIPIVNDDDEEGNETFTVTLATPRASGGSATNIVLGGTGLTQSIAVTILDDEGDKATLSVTTDRMTTIEGETFPITLTASVAPADDLTVAFTISGPGITTGDYTLTDMAATLLTNQVTFPTGETSMVLLMAAENDADVTVEVLTWTLDAVAADADYTVSPTDAVTVAINPRGAVSLPVVYVTATPDSIEERAQARIIIHAVPAPTAPLTIPFTISGAGITPADYTLTDLGNTAVASPIIVPVGVESVPLILTAADDADTTAQMLNFLLTAPAAGAGYMLTAVNAAPVTITPSQASPLTVEFDRADVSIKEAAAANPETRTIELNVVLSDLPRGSVEIPVVTRDGTATAGTDYTAVSTTLTFSGSTLRQRVMIELADDDVYEGNEAFTVEFGDLSGSHVTAGAVSVVTVTIDDDDAVTVDFVGVTGRQVHESAGSLDITMRLSAATANVVSIPYTVSGGAVAPATHGEDYYTPSGNLAGNVAVFAAGSTETVLSFPIVRDMTDEAAVELFQVGFGTLPAGVTARGAAGGVLAVSGQILDEEPEVSISRTVSGLLSSGRTSTGITIAVTNGITPRGDLSVNFGTSGTAVRRSGFGLGARGDYTLTSAATGEEFAVTSVEPSSGATVSSVTVPAASSNTGLRMQVVEDRDRSNEEAIITLMDGAGYTVSSTAGSVRATIVILIEITSITASTTSINENAGTFRIALFYSGDVREGGDTVAIPIRITGTATAGTDYQDSIFIVELDRGTEAGSVDIPILDDDIYEGDETLVFSLGDLSGTGATRRSPNPLTVTITDDDALSVSFVNIEQTVAEDAGRVNLVLRPDHAPGGPVTFTVGSAPQDPAATVAVDYILPTSVTLDAGATSALLPLTIVNDRRVEEDERFLVSLTTSAARVTPPADPAVITITDNDGPVGSAVQFAADTLEVAESGGMVAVTVELNAPAAAGGLSIPIMTANGTAMSGAGNDYTAVTTDVAIAAGATTGTAMIPILNDDTYEPDESFTVSFGSLPSGLVAGGRNRVHVDIIDDDTLTITGFSAATMLVDESAGTVNVDVAFGAALPAPLGIKYTWSAGTATLVDDFDPVHLQRSLLINTGAEEFRISAAITDDGIAENDETIFINLSAAPNVTITNPRLTIMIGDDDSLSTGMVGFTTDAVDVEENAGTVNVSLRLGAASGSAITIPVATANGTAEAGADYTALSGAATMVTFAAGETTQTVSIPITDDIVLEDPETFTVSLGSLPSGTTAGARTSVTVTIVNLTRTVQFSETMVEVAENAGTVVLTAELSAVTPAEIVIDAFTNGEGLGLGLTAAAFEDYTPPETDNVTFAPGSRTQTVSITILDDDLVESGETFRVAFGGLPPGITARNSVLVTIISDEAPALTVEFSAATQTVAENGGMATVTVGLSRPAANQVRFPVMTTDGTATAGTDYTATSTMVTFAAGETTQTVSIPILDDDVYEIAETFTAGFDLDGISGISAGAVDSVTVTIISEDTTAVAFVESTLSVIEEIASTVNVPVRLESRPGTALTIPVRMTGTATAGVDYTAVSSVTFAAGEMEQTIVIPILDDDLIEPEETITVTVDPNLLPGLTVHPIRSSTTVTIVSNDNLNLTLEPNVSLVVTAGESETFTLRATNGIPRTPLIVSSAFSNRSPGFNGTAEFRFIDPDGRIVPRDTVFSLPAGRNVWTFSLMAVDDSDGQAESVTMSISVRDPANRQIFTDGSIRLTINPSESPTVEFTEDDVPVRENSGMAEVELQLSRALGVSTTVPIATGGGTATADADYTAVTSVTFPAGVTTQTVTVPILDDDLIEDEETFTVSLGNLAGTGITAGTRTSTDVTIISGDTSVAFSVDAVRVTEADGATAEVELQLAMATVAAITVPIVVTAGTATANADYTAVTSVTFASLGPGAMTQTVSIPIINDDLSEPEETFTVSLGAPLPSGLVAGSRRSTEVTIVSEDIVAEFAVGAVSVAEDVPDNGAGRYVEVAIRLTAPAPAAVTIPVVTRDGSATAGDDYTALTDVSGSVSFIAGQIMNTVRIPIINDELVETPETFTVAFGTLPDGTTAGPRNSTEVTILSEDRLTVQFTETAVTVAEDVSGGTIELTAELNVAPTSDITIPVVTTDGTATAGADYTALAEDARVLFTPPDVRTSVISITILDEALPEGSETFTVSFGTLPDGVIAGANSSVTVTITSDETGTPPSVQFSAAAATVAENVSGGTTTVTLQLSAAATVETIVPIETRNGTAVAGMDYTALTDVTGSVTFAVGDTEQTLSITILDDTVFELNETFTVLLGELPSTVTAGTQTSTEITITSEDAAPPLMMQFSVSTLRVAENIGTVDVPIELNRAAASSIAIPVNTGGGTAIRGVDYSGISTSRSFAPGETRQVISITILDDAVFEPEETFVVSLGLSLPSGVTAGAQVSVTITIVSDDVAPPPPPPPVLPTVQFSAATAMVAEDAGTVELTLQLSEARAEAFTISGVVSVTGSSAVGGDTAAMGGCGCDYDFSPRNVTFAENAVTATISIPIVDDSLVEDNEVFIVSLRDSVLRDENLMVGARGLVRVTITSEDGPMLELVSGDVTVVAGERFPVMFRSINGVVSNDLNPWFADYVWLYGQFQR